MKIERVKNASRNIFFTGFLRVYQIIVPFMMRTVMIHYMGVQYLGLNSLFTSILQVLNLAELGVGSAMVYSMYSPIASDDTATICVRLKLYRLYYRIIGLVIACVGILLTPFVPYLVKSDLPAELNIYVLYLLNLSATVLTYWLFAYKNSLFQAHQRIDITSKITLVIDTIKYIVQFGVIIIFKDFYLYVIAALFCQIINNITTALIASRKYPGYFPKGTIDREESTRINGRIKDLFTAKLGGVILNSADSIVISSFLGLTVLAVYQNYYFILTAIISILTVVFQSCTAGIGNSIIVETKEKNFRDFMKFDFIISWFAGSCTCCFLCIVQPFMRIWVGNDLMLNMSAVVCFCVYFFIYEVNHLLNTYKDAAGMWHADRFRPLVTSLTNLILNLILVNVCGIYGVLLSTVIATLFVGMPWLIHNIFTTIFDTELRSEFLRKQTKYLVAVIVSCLLCYLVCHFIPCNNNYLSIFINLAICVAIPCLVFVLGFSRTTEFKGSMGIIYRITHGKIKYLKKFM